MNQNVEMNIGNGNINNAGQRQRQRQNAAIQTLRNKMSAIPQSNEVVSAMVLDWVNNIGPEELNDLTYEHIRELVEGIYQDEGQNPPGFTDDDYKQMFNFFTVFVREFHGEQVQGGGTSSKKVFWPPKYYKGLSKTRKAKRAKEIKRFTRYHWKDPRAYVGFKTNVGVRTKASSYTELWHRLFPDATSLEAKSKVTGVPLGPIRESYNRGMAAWRTGHRPGATQQQWGYARVHSFLLCGKTHYSTDADLVRKAKAKSAAARNWWKVCPTV